jgi:hypothetical protein
LFSIISSNGAKMLSYGFGVVAWTVVFTSVILLTLIVSSVNPYTLQVVYMEYIANLNTSLHRHVLTNID